MNGVLLLDKPAGISSAEVVRRVRQRLLSASRRPKGPVRVGHLGTLDPIATGVLPILIGEATKLAPFLEGGTKQYEGVIRLGVETDTLDRDGTEVRRVPVPALDAPRLASVAADFTGSIVQTPPIFSAIKRGGVPLYKLARRGVEVEPPAVRTVRVERLKLESNPDDPASIRFTVECSPGTYVRSLARDIGIALGTAAHLYRLRRVSNGSFRVRDALALEAGLEALDAGRPGVLIAMSAALGEMPAAEVGANVGARVRNGDSRALDALAPPGAELFKLVHEGRLIAVARATSRVTAEIVRVFAE